MTGAEDSLVQDGESRAPLRIARQFASRSEEEKSNRDDSMRLPVILAVGVFRKDIQIS